MREQTPQPSLQSLARYLGWGEGMTDEGIFAFAVGREKLLRVAQGLLETHKSDGTTAEEAIRDRVSTLTARCEALEQQRNQALFDADERDALLARCEALETELEHQKAETTRAVLHYTVKGYTAGENADSKHWRERAETAEARCEALEQEKEQLDILLSQASQQAMLNRRAYLEEHDRAEKAIDENICLNSAEVEALSVRCEALTAERDRQAAEIEAWKLDYAIAVASRDAEIARLGGKPGEVGGGTGEGDAPDRPDRQTYMQADSTTVDALRSRCQHLEQAAKDLSIQWRGVKINLDARNYYYDGQDVDYGRALQAEECAAALASLLPTQEEPTQTDENRVSFAAGYSQALDDQAKGLK